MGLFGCKKEIWLVVGLGNCEDKYARTRHNSGFSAVDALAAKLGLTFNRKKCASLLAEGRHGDKKLVLAKPQTYMNASGTAVSGLVSFYKVPLDHVVVICDDVDLPEGALRIREKGGPGTHNGMRDVVLCLGGEGFPRVRIGVGTPPPGWDLADYVLGNFTSDMSAVFDAAADAALCLVDEGAAKAQQKFNRKG